MSKFFESIYELIGNLLNVFFWGAVIFALLYAWNSDRSLKELFNKSDKKETWINAERSLGSYSTILDEKWASSIFDSIRAKVKLRESLTEENNNKMDFSYEVKTKLTRPVFTEPNKYSEVDYRVIIHFKFIDEDGFIIDSFNASWFEPMHGHEKYKRTNLDYNWNDAENEGVIVKTLLLNRIHANTAKIVKKIVYEPEIKVTRQLQTKSKDLKKSLESLGKEDDAEKSRKKFWEYIDSIQDDLDPSSDSRWMFIENNNAIEE